MAQILRSSYISFPISTNVTSPPLSPISDVPRVAQQALSHTYRPWRVLFSNFTLPLGFHDALYRVLRNLNYYCFNYSLIVLTIVFLSLIGHTIAMLVFLAVIIFWIFFYFSRDAPVVIYCLVIDDRLMILGLGVGTVAALVLTSSVWFNVLVSSLVGLFLIAIHSIFRSYDDQFLDEI